VKARTPVSRRPLADTIENAVLLGVFEFDKQERPRLPIAHHKVGREIAYDRKLERETVRN
ncbi:MAG TPA: hypothetical protein VG125_06090, partial [Pirellulales bacterium]|nr:hypothetical protein [Pirellulales bacterium]